MHAPIRVLIYFATLVRTRYSRCAHSGFLTRANSATQHPRSLAASLRDTLRSSFDRRGRVETAHRDNSTRFRFTRSVPLTRALLPGNPKYFVGAWRITQTESDRGCLQFRDGIFYEVCILDFWRTAWIRVRERRYSTSRKILQSESPEYAHFFLRHYCEGSSFSFFGAPSLIVFFFFSIYILSIGCF